MAERLRAKDVFTPGSFPTHTYVQRSDAQLDQQLRLGLDTQGMIVSIAGPSKSGKTVLVERVVGEDNLVPVTGATPSERPVTSGREPSTGWGRRTRPWRPRAPATRAH
jgi:hypothetical protein